MTPYQGLFNHEQWPEWVSKQIRRAKTPMISMGLAEDISARSQRYVDQSRFAASAGVVFCVSLAEMNADPFNLAGDIWTLTLAASFLASLGVCVVQTIRGKPVWDTPALPFLCVLGLASLLPLVIPILAIFLTISGLGWLVQRLASPR